MDILINIGIAVAMFALMFHIAARYEIRKDEQKGERSTRRLLRMRRVSGRIVGIAGVLTLISMAVPTDEPESEEIKTETRVESEEDAKVAEETDTAEEVVSEESSIEEESSEVAETTEAEPPTYAFDSTQAEADYFTAIGLTLESGVTTMQDVAAMSRMCGKVCPDVPGDDWGLQLEAMNAEVFELDHRLYDFALGLSEIPEGGSPNIDFAARDELVRDMKTMNEFISVIMTKTDWQSWKDGWDTVDEAVRLMEKMYMTNVYTVPTSE